MAQTSDAQQLREPFLRSRSGRAWFLLLGLAVLVSAATGGALYRSNVHWFETNKLEETATALRLVDAMVANYTEVRTAMMAENAPVPAAFRAHAIERFNAARDGEHQIYLDWLGVPGREVERAAEDPLTAAALRHAAETGQTAPRSEWLESGKGAVFRTIAPSIASQQACVDCHNSHRADSPPLQLGDILGAFVIDVPAADFLLQTRRDAAAAGALIFLVVASLSGAILILQHRRLEAEGRAAASAERAQSDAEARRLAEAESGAKSRFLALMSHELRTPLNAILGFSEIIARQTMGAVSPRYVGYAQDIHRSGQHLLTLISDILELARAESGRLQLAEEDTTLFDVVDPCVRLIAPRAQQQGVALSVALKQDMRLYADATKLRQTVLNLLTNAVKFTPAGGRVEIRAKLHGSGGLAIQVADTGIGIKAEDIPQAMLPFGRLKAAEKIEGTGLGLPLAKMLTELHDGVLSLSSMPGHGTRVTIHLPPHRVRPFDAPEAEPAEPRRAS